MKSNGTTPATPAFPPLSEWARRLLNRLTLRPRGNQPSKPRLELVDRIALAPRQSLALVEADGRLVLIATSAEGGPAFYPLDRTSHLDRPRQATARDVARVSW